MKSISKYYANEMAAFSDKLLMAVGTPPADAKMVTESLISASLTGHDSHGMILLPSYLEEVKSGLIRPGSRVSVVYETPIMARLNGNLNYGQVVARKALSLALEKAERAGIALVVSYRTNHVGRLGQYTLLAAEKGFIGIMMVNTNPSVAPWGGYQRKLGTNPISIASPRKNRNPILLDMATSVVAMGKVLLKVGTGEKIPEGWIIDKNGKASTTPEDYSAGGALLSAGTYKGYGLGLMIDLLCGAFNGAGGADTQRGNGVLMMLFKPDLFVPREEYLDTVERVAKFVVSSPPIEGFDKILLPGDPEYIALAERSKNGIPVHINTMVRLKKVAQDLNVPFPFKINPLTA